MTNPINKTASAYVPFQHIEFEPVLQNVAQAKPQANPVTTRGNISLPVFNKMTAGKLPSAALTIRALIRGNSS